MSISNTFQVAVNSPAGQSALEAAAVALSAGQSASFTHNPNSTQYDIQWCIRGHYDPVRKCVQYSGKPASSQSHNWSHNYYDEDTATWTRQSAFYTGTSPSGHVWGGHDIDPTTGDYYLHLYKTATVAKRVTGGSGAWTIDATASTGTGTDSITGTSVTGPSNGLAWHPSLFGTNDPGFIIGTRYKIKAWRKNTNTWSNPTLTGSYAAGSGSGGSLYLPGQDVAVIGTGTTESTLWTIGAGSGGVMASAVERGPTPRQIHGAGGTTTGSSKMIVDPRNSSRIMMLDSNDSSLVRISSDLGDTWTTDGTHPFNSMPGAGTSNAWIAISIAAYGVVLGMTDTASLLWKPS